jgi:hypothetical protein
MTNSLTLATGHLMSETATRNLLTPSSLVAQAG